MTRPRSPALSDILGTQVPADSTLPTVGSTPMSPSQSDRTHCTEDDLAHAGHVDFSSYNSTTTIEVDPFSDDNIRQLPEPWGFPQQAVTYGTVTQPPPVGYELRPKEAMSDGRPFSDSHPELVRARERCSEACRNYNQIFTHNVNIRDVALGLILDKAEVDKSHNARILPPFTCAYGYHLTLGLNLIVGEGFDVDDSASVTLGNDIRIGKYCSLKTSSRVDGSSPPFHGPATAHPIEVHNRCTIEDRVQIHGGSSIGDLCKIMLGARIGRRVTIKPRCSIGIGCIIEDGVFIEEGCLIDANATIRKGAILDAGCVIGVGCVIESNAHIREGSRIESSATVDREAIIGAGCAIGTGCIIEKNVRIGRNCIVRSRSIIQESAVIDPEAVLESGCIIGSWARLGASCLVGAGMIVRDNGRVLNGQRLDI